MNTLTLTPNATLRYRVGGFRFGTDDLIAGHAPEVLRAREALGRQDGERLSVRFGSDEVAILAIQGMPNRRRIDGSLLVGAVLGRLAREEAVTVEVAA